MYTSSIKKIILAIKISSYLCKQLTYILKIYALRMQLTKPQHLRKHFMSQNEIHEVAIGQRYISTQITALIVCHFYHQLRTKNDKGQVLAPAETLLFQTILKKYKFQNINRVNISKNLEKQKYFHHSNILFIASCIVHTTLILYCTRLVQKSYVLLIEFHKVHSQFLRSACLYNSVPGVVNTLNETTG